MDPISLLVLGALALSALPFATAQAPADPFRYRKILSWTDGWVATELCSLSALSTATVALDLPTDVTWQASLASGMKKFVLVVRQGGPADYAVLCIFDRMGASWELSQCYGVGMNRTMRPEQDQHISELAQHLRKDVGKEVAERARQISDPARRYDFLRAVVRQPSLAAKVVPDPDFVDVVVETVQIVHPERMALLEGRSSSFEPIGSDLVVRRLPLAASSVPMLP